MVKSMTGFGRCEVANEVRKVTVEVKAVNHRYLDMNIKMPRQFGMFEIMVRNIIKEYAVRGKMDVFIMYESYSEKNLSVNYNKEIAKSYVEHINEIAKDFSLDNELKAASLSRYPEVFTIEELTLDEDAVAGDIEKALRGALENFVDARVKEGENLKSDILIKLDTMLSNVSHIEKRAPEIINSYHEKLTEKVKEYLADASVDESRILTEVTIFTDKVCIDEEIVRLKSHIEAMRDTLNSEGDLGRKLDFIAQEMNREANTILSKANDLDTSNYAIDIKTDIEKVREQIQNIE